jgi:hypothetical protein
VEAGPGDNFMTLLNGMPVKRDLRELLKLISFMDSSVE